MKRKHIARKIFAMTIAATMCMGLSPAGSVLAASDQMVSYTAVQADPTQPTTQEPATTQADTNTKDDKDTQSETVTLNIDNENQYDGMEKPYAQGYVPINANGSVRIVFPILSEGELRGTHYGRRLIWAMRRQHRSYLKTTRRISGCRPSR